MQQAVSPSYLRRSAFTIVESIVCIVILVVIGSLIYVAVLANPDKSTKSTAKVAPPDSTWKSDISELFISDATAKEVMAEEIFCGLANEGYPADYAGTFGGIVAGLVAAIIAFILTLVVAENTYDGEAVGCGVITFIIAIVVICQCVSGVLTYWEASEHVAKAQKLRPLWEDVTALNRTLTNIHVIDQLAEAGNAVAIEARPEVIRAIRQTRETLLTALRTDKILRENPDFDRQQLAATNLAPAQEADELSNRAGELSNALNSALEIDLRTRERLKAMLAQDQ